MNQTLSEAIEQFSKWRKDKRGRKKIPDELWQLACDSSDELDIGSVSRILRLNPDQLSLRVKARSSSPPPPSPRVVPFPQPESFAKTEPVESIVVAEASTDMLTLKIHRGATSAEIHALLLGLQEAGRSS